eukprot:CAMPEP_0184504220 /NCGR_PEP_ID=MMETSP0113_2-20130426/52347_1 /TAXON_ID=91329 /ORGANISM="Norrisiella sphaerica, Strain BC52" /LENGTH=198 /DNA_ID=CAMNT_0026893845 /DNA_START=398 /DNA_END=994 /DNA_ORIENTATION=+
MARANPPNPSRRMVTVGFGSVLPAYLIHNAIAGDILESAKDVARDALREAPGADPKALDDAADATAASKERFGQSIGRDFSQAATRQTEISKRQIRPVSDSFNKLKDIGNDADPQDALRKAKKLFNNNRFSNDLGRNLDQIGGGVDVQKSVDKLKKSVNNLGDITRAGSADQISSAYKDIESSIKAWANDAGVADLLN